MRDTGARRVGVRRAGRGVVALLLGGAMIIGGPVPASAAAPPVTPLGPTTLDSSALFFVSYDGIVNNASYQQNAILTWAGYQYAAWYTASRAPVVARRALSGTAWQRVTLPHALSTNDSHNSISLGVSPSDGRLHVAMDTHDSRIFYVKSEAGLVTNPGSRTWTAARFGAVQRTLDGLELGNITYPRFVITNDNRMQFSFRTGGSGNGTQELAEYSTGGTWSRLGRWSSATGSYSQHGATSTTRNMYLHGLTYGPSGRLHATFTWREGNTAVLCNGGGLANHDTGYVYSDDRGRTWRNNAGTVVGNTGGTLVSVTSPGHVVDPLNVDHALINQESQAVDSAGNIHAIISYVPGRFTQCVNNFVAQRRSFGRAFHVFRNSSGVWTKREIPVALNAFGRSRIVFDRSDNAYVVLPYGRIVAASRASTWTDWTQRYDGAGLNAFGEVVVDDYRVRTDNVLSILAQQSSSGSTPSPIRVVDVRLG
jgi:hypothetical protein